jgi:carboxypeptidase D
MRTYPQPFGFNSNAYEYFVEQYNLCGYNLTLSYPSRSAYPTLRASGQLSRGSGDDTIDRDNSSDANADGTAKRGKRLLDLYHTRSGKTVHGAIEVHGRRHVKRAYAVPPPFSPTGIIDPDCQYHVLEHIEDYAKNYTIPWSELYSYPLLHKPN